MMVLAMELLLKKAIWIVLIIWIRVPPRILVLSRNTSKRVVKHGADSATD
jgi:hypothetical protein